MKYISIVCLLLLGNGLVAQTIIKASDFGVLANNGKDAAAGIRAAIASCKKQKNAVLVLPGGRIDIYPEHAVQRELYISNATESDSLSKQKTIAFDFDHCKNLTLEGNNTLVVLHGKMISFSVLYSSNITVRNIQFDYERPTMSELTIRSKGDSLIETSIHPDSKFSIDNGRIIFFGEGWKTNSFHTIRFDPKKDRLYYSNLKPLLDARAVQVNATQVNFAGSFSKSGYNSGDVLSFRDPYRDNCGAFISRSKNIQLANVQMHYMHGLGIVSQFSENISLFKVRVAPRENSGRIMSSFADCFHFSGCKGLVKIDSCFTSGAHDDAVNVHGTHLQITDIDSLQKIRLRFMHHQTYGFEAFFAGDSIAFIHPQTLMPLATAVVKKAKLVNKKEMEIEVVGKLDHQVVKGLCIENLSWTPKVIIRNSRFERTNTRGMLITTRKKVLIENNTFYHTGMFPILIANDASSWFESGAVQDVVIRNNVFEDCGYNSGSGAIYIAPENHELKPGNMVHRNIRIINNQFKLINNTVLSARSVDQLLFTGNTISTNDAALQLRPFISLLACKHVTIQQNFSKGLALPIVHAKMMTAADVKADGSVKMEQVSNE
ncbi:MAG TPA: right-handed parallel beta-helix repeat-containing protein [Phnomibacter sp.]|nr:right-handed parallel beta-helix repeat-containing protein [Phnomibacter sp.]